jgi:hypothetical protein
MRKERGLKNGGEQMKSTQNVWLMEKTAFEKRTFLIHCKDEKDANSKRVSLYNVRRMLPEELQGNVSVQKMQVEGEWRIRLSYEESQVTEEINGVSVKVDLMKHPLEGRSTSPWNEQET